MKGRRAVTAGVLIAAGLVPLGVSGGARAAAGARPRTGPGRSAAVQGPACPTWVVQQPDGRFTTCLRLGALPAGPATVSLELDRLDGGGTGPAVGPVAVLILSPASGPPGTRIVIHGTTPAHRSGTVPDLNATVCWDGCGATGLTEQGLPFRWTTPHTFVTTLTVPSVPWLGARAIEPLNSGPYQVGIECLLVLRGCAEGGPEGSATFDLRAPPHGRCTAGQPCATVSVRPASALPATLVRVSGWAPLDTIIGTPFGVQVGVRSGRPPRRSSDAPGHLGIGLSRYVLASAALHVLAPPSWASLGPVRVAAEQAAGVSPVAAAPGVPDRLAWCAPGVIRVRGGGPTRIPIGGVVPALRRAGLVPLGPVSAALGLSCASVALDAHDPGTAYAAFAVQPAPPIQLVAVVTTDAGAHWRRVPVPPGASPTGFGGYRQFGGATTAVFAGGAAERPGQPPLLATVTTDGGRLWTAARPGCPAAGPCLTLGPFVGGNCAMNGEGQLVLRGTPVGGDGGGAHAHTVAWAGAGWVDSVDPCMPAQLVSTRRQGALLVGGGSPYPILRSERGGRDWAAVGLPRPPGPDQQGGLPGGLGFTLLPDGALLDTAAGAPSGAVRWALLPAAGRRWCPVAVPIDRQPFAASAVMVAGSQLAWLTTTPLRNGVRVVLHTVPLSRMHC